MHLTSEKLMTGLGKSWEECDVLLVRDFRGSLSRSYVMDALHSLKTRNNHY